jgi:hypothetical protein
MASYSQLPGTRPPQVCGRHSLWPTHPLLCQPGSGQAHPCTLQHSTPRHSTAQHVARAAAAVAVNATAAGAAAAGAVDATAVLLLLLLQKVPFSSTGRQSAWIYHAFRGMRHGMPCSEAPCP